MDRDIYSYYPDSVQEDLTEKLGEGRMVIQRLPTEPEKRLEKIVEWIRTCYQAADNDVRVWANRELDDSVTAVIEDRTDGIRRKAWDDGYNQGRLDAQRKANWKYIP